MKRLLFMIRTVTVTLDMSAMLNSDQLSLLNETVDYMYNESQQSSSSGGAIESTFDSDQSLKDKVDSLIFEVKSLEKKTDRILELLGNKFNSCDRFEQEITKYIPVKEVEGMEQLSDVLMDKMKRKQLRSYLMMFGGSNVSSNVRTVMKECITYECASLYSLLGHKGKKSFRDLPLYKVIVQTVLLSQNGTSQAVIDQHITSFLKHAPEKPGCSRYKGSNSSSRAASSSHQLEEAVMDSE